MISEIKNKYKGFHDALIFDILYSNRHGKQKGLTPKVIVGLNAFNIQTEKWEQLKLIFSDVVKFWFFEGKNEKGKAVNSTVVFEAYIEKIDDLIIFDFFALQVDGRDLLAENPNSDFVIHCKDINYELVNAPIL